MARRRGWRWCMGLVVGCWALASGPGLAWGFAPPGSGQTKCYDDSQEIPCPAPGQPFYGQDGNYAATHPRSYTKLDAAGNDLAASAATWAMVRDKVTGLVWEAKTDDGGFHDKDNKYTWCDSNPATNGGVAGTCGGGMGTEAFIATLNSQAFGGHSDWRLPTMKELASLVNRGTFSPAIDMGYFPLTGSSSYWSATTYANYTYSAWHVYFDYGYDGDVNKSNAYYVRAVRSGQCLGPLQVNGDGTVTDASTGLMWQQAPAAAALAWQAALAYAEELTLAGYSDWRLPSQEELGSLVDYSKFAPAIDTTAFPGPWSSSYWSATTLAVNAAYAWRVNFDYGNVYHYDKSYSYYVRAVRSGQWLVISSPPQAATVGIGTSQAIHWDPQGLGGQSTITLSRDGGLTWEAVATVANIGNYDWQVSGPTTVNAVLRVVPEADPTKSGEVGLFSIATPTGLTLTPTVTAKFTTYTLAVEEQFSNGATQPLAVADLTWAVQGPATLAGKTLTATGQGLATISASYGGFTTSTTVFLADPANPDGSEAEPNNEPASADHLPAGQVWKAEALAADTDLFALHLEQAALIRVDYLNTSSSADVTVEVVDSQGQVAATVTSVNGASQIISCGLLAGDHLLRVKPSGDVDQDGAYLLSWQVEQFIDIPASLSLALGGQITSSLYSLSDSRALTFTVATGQPLALTFTPTSPSAVYTLTLTNGAGQAVNTWTASGQPLSITTGLASGPHTMTVSQTANVDAAHPFTVALAAASGQVEQEPNALASQATPLAMGGVLQAMLPSGDTDLFRLSLPQPTLVKLTLAGSSKADYRLTLLEPGGTAIDGTLSTSGAATLAVGLLAGDYLVRVEANGQIDQAALYTLALTTASTPGLEVEPNDTLETANGLDTIAPRSGRIYSATDTDLFGYTLATKTSYAITFTPSATAAGYAVEVVNPADTVLATKTSTDGGAVTLNLTPKAAGTFYLRVKAKAAGNIDPYATYSVTMATTAEVTALVKLAGLTATPGQSGLAVNGTTTITVQAIYSDAQAVAKTAADGVTYASSNPAVAAVDGNGQVTGLTDGYATITVAYQGQAVAVNLTVGTPQTVVSQDRGNLIIVAGGTMGDALDPATQALSELAYQKFKARTFTDSDIYYFDHQPVHDLNGDGYDDAIVDDPTPSTDELTSAISGWAKEQSSSGPLYLYLVDHGAKGGLFQVASGQILTAPMLAVALDSFQAATGRPVVVIIEACYSGGFVAPLANPSYQRLVLTSVDSASLAYLGASGTPSYSWFFLAGLYQGLSIGDSLTQAKADLLVSGGGYNAMAPQVGGAEALQGLKVGGDFLLAGLFPELSAGTASQPVNAGTLGLSIQVKSMTGGLTVWAVIVPPDYAPPQVSADFETPVDALPKVTLVDEDPLSKTMDGAYVGNYAGFSKNGPYTVIFYAKDSDNNLTKSAPVTITVSGGEEISTTTTTTLAISKGWTLLSSTIPFDATEVLSGETSVWKWDGGVWAVTLPGSGDKGVSYASGKGFKPLTTITSGEGFWVNSEAAKTVSVTGQPQYGELAFGPGWNLVGLKAQAKTQVVDLAQAHPGVVSVWKWVNGVWAVNLPGSEDTGAGYAAGKVFAHLTEINPGDGFWVNMP